MGRLDTTSRTLCVCCHKTQQGRWWDTYLGNRATEATEGPSQGHTERWAGTLLWLSKAWRGTLLEALQVPLPLTPDHPLLREVTRLVQPQGME